MNKQELIEMVNRDLTDEHAAIIRYLVHGYLEGEDTPLGAGLLSRAREEMWHMHWLGMIIGNLLLFIGKNLPSSSCLSQNSRAGRKRWKL